MVNILSEFMLSKAVTVAFTYLKNETTFAT